ncbi:MAG: sulfite exporter TauE/SafE family protein [Candidatus Neomarinimicrobiota bacterium]
MFETIILILAAFATSILSAVIGMGGGITLLGIMAILIPEGYMVVALHGVIQLVSNVTRTAVYREHVYRPIIRQYFMGIIPGLGCAALIVFGLIQYFHITSASEFKFDFLKPLIGIYILWFLYLRKKTKLTSDSLFFWMGGLSGLVTVFIGAAGPLIAPFFIDRDLTKENIIATKAACQIMGHLGKMPIFIIFFGVDYLQQWPVLLPLVISVYFGTRIGKKFLGSLSADLFKKLFKIALTLIAIRLVIVELIILF